MPLRNRLFALVSAGLLTHGASHAAETTALDAPGLDPGIEATTILHLDVRAGATGAPNGFTIEWMPRLIFDARGGWPENPLDPAIQFAIYLGTPTLNTEEGTRSFLLGPGDLAKVEIGDLFDETGVTTSTLGEMSVGTEYVVRVRANGDGGMSGGGNNLVAPSPYSGTSYAWTKENSGTTECVHSQGYWKTHPEAWLLANIKLGNIIYTKAQCLEIWNTPAEGNGLVSLAHQLMAAKLNIAAGAIAPASVSAAILAADALIGTRVIPPIGAGSLTPAATSQLTDELEEFNTEESGNIQCHVTTSAKTSTWAGVKAIYR